MNSDALATASVSPMLSGWKRSPKKAALPLRFGRVAPSWLFSTSGYGN
jgi:hypothetical protein